MTRAERRRVERENRKQPTYNLSKDQLQGIKQEATHDAAETAFLLMLGIPVLMFKDHFGQLYAGMWMGRAGSSGLWITVSSFIGSLIRGCTHWMISVPC